MTGAPLDESPKVTGDYPCGSGFLRHEGSLPTADHKAKNSFRAFATSLARRLMNAS